MKVLSSERARERESERGREIYGEKEIVTERQREIEDLQIKILSHEGYESSLILKKGQWFGN